MPRALFTSKNLIGDGLYIQPALAEWVTRNPGWDIDLLTLNDHITCIYDGMGIPRLKTIFDRDESVQYDFEFVFKVNDAFTLGETERLHISQAYWKMLHGVPPELPQKVDFDPGEGTWDEDAVKDGRPLILLSMFSNSCASREGKPPNKMLSWSVWHEVIVLLRQWGNLRALGGPKDYEAAPLALKPEEYLTGAPLPYVARTMRHARLLITIDNGMAHLGASQGLPIILFYPKVLGQHWIIPSGSAKLVVYHIDPMTLDAELGKTAVREGLKSLFLKGERNGTEKESNQEVKGPEGDGSGIREDGGQGNGENAEGEIQQEETQRESDGRSDGGVLPG